MIQYRTRIAAVAAGAVLLSSCSILAPRPDPSRFYVLTSVDEAQVSEAPLAGVSLGLGPIPLPDYLQRPELVRRTAPTEVRPSEIDRWAGSLDTNVARVTAENLARMLGTDRVWTYPSFEVGRSTYLVDVYLDRFELDTENTAHLAAHWQVRANGPKTQVTSRETRTTQAATSGQTAAGVEALSATLGDLSRDIAAAVRELHGRTN